MPNFLKFPLEDTDTYAGQVFFQVVKEIPPTVSFSGTAQTSNTSTTRSSAVPNMPNLYTADDRSVTYSRTRYELGDRITLYMPQGIQFSDGVSYEEFALGRFGAGIEQAIKGGEGLGGALSAEGERALSSITDFFNEAKTPASTRLAAARLAKMSGETRGAAVTSALQTTTNPNKRLLFKEVNLREFSFNFKLIPTSQAEGNAIERIVSLFRTEMYPEDSVKIGGVPIGYAFPNKFEITFVHNNSTVAHRILPSYLVNMQTTYNPTGMGFHEDNKFSETEITMTFRESRTLSKEDVQVRGY